MATLEAKPQKLSILIWPSAGKYAAACLELSNVDVQSTPQQAAESITSIIQGQILSALQRGVSFQELLFAARPKYYERYKTSAPFQHTPVLEHGVIPFIEGIEYRISSDEI